MGHQATLASTHQRLHLHETRQMIFFIRMAVNGLCGTILMILQREFAQLKREMPNESHRTRMNPWQDEQIYECGDFWWKGGVFKASSHLFIIATFPFHVRWLHAVCLPCRTTKWRMWQIDEWSSAVRWESVLPSWSKVEKSDLATCNIQAAISFDQAKPRIQMPHCQSNKETRLWWPK